MSPRNVFENHEEEEGPKKVPLTLEDTGEVIGEAWIGKDGNAIKGKLTEEAYKKYFPQPESGSYSIADPADRYRVSPQQDEMDVPYGRPPQ